MKWVEALRSGEYKQTKETLKDCNGYCCLGVLCEISGIDRFVREDLALRYDGKSGTLSERVKKWAGMKDGNGARSGLKKSLADLNDDSNYSFKRIANIIEKEYKDL